MVSTINMQDMRYLNLFSKITRINTRYCIKYNDMIIFCVPRISIPQALGEDSRNIRQISEILRKRIRIISAPKEIHDAKRFIEDIVRPVTFKDLEITPSEIILTAGSQNKAALIGRNRRRLLEMQKIVKDYFKRDFKII